MKSTNKVVANALAAVNAAGVSTFFKRYADIAKDAIDEIKYSAEGELRKLSGSAKELADKARKAKDDKAANDIERCQKLLGDALDRYVDAMRRIVGAA